MMKMDSPADTRFEANDRLASWIVQVTPVVKLKQEGVLFGGRRFE
jgi:hypothetical protein